MSRFLMLLLSSGVFASIAWTRGSAPSTVPKNYHIVSALPNKVSLLNRGKAHVIDSGGAVWECPDGYQLYVQQTRKGVLDNNLYAIPAGIVSSTPEVNNVPACLKETP